jgi:hypothetical protein
MTDDSTKFNSLQERNQQTLSNIKSLQDTEMKLYDNLEQNSLTPEQKANILNKINQISQMRMNLYSGLKDMYSSYQKNVSTTKNGLAEQMIAINIVEKELDEAKKRKDYLEQQEYNKLRMVEINTYYGKRYDGYKQVMKTVVYTCIPLIIITILANKNIIPSSVNTILTSIIIVISCMIIVKQIIDLSNRDNMNFDEYKWYFNKENAPENDTDNAASSDENDPWTTSSYTCVGSECCYDGSIYDETQNMCIPSKVNNFNNSSNSNSSSSSSSDKKMTESMISGILSKYAFDSSPPVARMKGNKVQPSLSLEDKYSKYASF